MGFIYILKLNNKVIEKFLVTEVMEIMFIFKVKYFSLSFCQNSKVGVCWT